MRNQFSYLCHCGLMASLVSACGGESGPVWRGTIDTLAGGVILVSNPAQGIWGPATGWQLVEEWRIGSIDGEGPETFAEVSYLAVDAMDRVHVLDRQHQEIRVFESDGSYLRTIGRTGDGPGEFRLAFGMDFDPAGNMWVVDPRHPYYTVFDSVGQYTTTFRREATRYGYRWEGRFLTSGELYDYTGIQTDDGREAGLVRYDTAFGFDAGVLLPQYSSHFYTFEYTGGSTQALVPFAGRLAWLLDPRGFIWAGVSDAYRIYRITLDGDTVGAVERRSDPAPVTGTERDAALERLREIARGAPVDASRIPDHKAAFDRFDVDDEGYLWVRPPLPDGETGTVFDVFDPDGMFLGSIRAAANISSFAPVLIRRGSVYAVHIDELGVHYVVKLRIEKRP